MKLETKSLSAKLAGTDLLGFDTMAGGQGGTDHTQTTAPNSDGALGVKTVAVKVAVKVGVKTGIKT